MRVLMIGGTGTIGQAVAKELAPDYDLILAGHTRGDVTVDITHLASISRLYKKVGKIDAIIATTGKVFFGALQAMTPETFNVSINDKLMGQINVTLLGLDALNDHGSITLTSGILNREPIKAGAQAAMVNGALEGFVKSAALEMPRGIRINIISPAILYESVQQYGEYFQNCQPVSAAQVAVAYRRSLEGAMTGEVLVAE